MRAGFSMPPGFDWIIVLEKNTTVFFFFPRSFFETRFMKQPSSA